MALRTTWAAFRSTTGAPGFFAQFDYHDTKDLQAADLIGDLTLDYRLGPWSGRVLSNHMSSHLGDDFIRSGHEFPGTREWNAIKGLLSYDFTRHLRLYAGEVYTIESKGMGTEPYGSQGGFELFSRIFCRNHLQAYWANDLQAWGRTSWNPAINSQLGLKTATDLTRTRAVTFFLEFFSGHDPIGQFYQQNTTRWDMGIKFELSR